MCEKALVSRDLWRLQGGFPMLIILSSVIKSRLWEHINTDSWVDRKDKGYVVEIGWILRMLS